MKLNNTGVAGVLTGNNSYGYRLNVNHPQINALYRRYKKWKGLPECYPLTDEQRREFEDYIFRGCKINIPPVN